MKNFYLLTYLIIFGISAYSQDLIFTLDNKIISAKVLEISIEKIRYKRYDYLTGPTYEILKTQVHQIKYKNGTSDLITPLTEDLIKAGEDSSLTAKARINGSTRPDTLNYALFYILYNSGQDESMKFRVYMNGTERVVMRNHTRAVYKIYTEGPMLINRQGVLTYGKGPFVNCNVKHGYCYGLKITVLDPQGWTSSTRLGLTLINEDEEFKKFLNEEFFGFKPFKSCDLVIEEKKVD